VERRLEKICEHLLEGKTEQEKLLSADPHFARITELFEDRVGAPYSEPDLDKAYETARERFSKQVPPGFKDLDKPEPARYGDFVGWRQILAFAVKNKVSVILVTDDAKDDWWRREGSQTFGPHPQLVVEFRSCCAGLFYMYSSDRFLELSGTYIVGGPVDPKAISELKERRESEAPPDVARFPPVAQLPTPKTTCESSEHIHTPDPCDPERAWAIPTTPSRAKAVRT